MLRVPTPDHASSSRRLVVLLALLLAVGLALPTAASATPNLGTDYQRTWSATWMARGGAPFTHAEAVQIARDHDVVVGMRVRLRPHLDAMRATNPDIILLGYVNATFQGSGHPSGWYANNRNGNRIHATDWPTTHLMRFDTAAVRAHISGMCDDLGSEGFDGCLLDVMGSGPLWGDYLSSAPFHQGSAWTHRQWINWANGLAVRVRNDNPDLLVAGNGLGSGVRWFSEDRDPSVFSETLPAMEAEMFVRDAHASVNTFRTEARWQQDIDMIVEAEQMGSGVMTMTKVWTTATNAQRAQWRQFAYASFLLGTNGRSMFSFVDSKTLGASTESHPLFKMPLGEPTGAYRKTDGLYRRTFTDGLVLVNPTDQGVTAALSRSFVTHTGATVDNSVRLAPHTGLVLQADDAGEQEPPTPEEYETRIFRFDLEARRLTVGGRAEGPALRRVNVAIQNRATRQWLRPNGTWGSWRSVEVNLWGTTANSTGYRVREALPPGDYFLMAQARGPGAARDTSPVTRRFTVR